MKKIVLSLLFVSVLLLAAQAVYAADAVILVSPSSATKNTGSAFSVNVQLNPAGNKSCVVKGTLNFTNLSCQGITVAPGLMSQTAPTCSSPSFIIGIPKCTTALQNIMAVSARGIAVGQAELAVSGVNIIGAGNAVPFSAQPGIFSIAKAPAQILSSAVSSQSSSAGESQQSSSSSESAIDEEIIEVSAPASFLSTASKYFWPLLLLLIVLGFVYWIYKKSSKKNISK